MKQNIEVLYFSTSWCGSCKMFKPVFQQFANEHPEIQVKYIDLEQDAESYNHLHINAVPTIVFLKNGNEGARISGIKSKKMLEQALEDITF
jgi:thiol-disulfide isomerase/thioredoxin